MGMEMEACNGAGMGQSRGMIDYTSQYEVAGAVRERQLADTFKIVYGWMGAGLALSGAVAWKTAASGLWMKVLAGPWMWVCILAEFALVIGLSAGIRKLNAAAAGALFAGYAALNGLTLSVVFIAYDLALVQRAFFVSAAMFGGFALYGTFTKSDLGSIGSVCSMALWGLILASLANLFLRSSGLDWVVTVGGVAIFSGLTMYDAQKIRRMADEEESLDGETVRKLGILGALALYLDFVNLFLHLLRFLGKKR